MTVVNKELYQAERNQLLETILNYRFFYPWKGIENVASQKCLAQDTALELYFTNTCNQHCEYCYLVKYPELYPAEYNKSDIILKNLKIIYNYILSNKLHIPCFDFFSGEIWGTKLGDDIFNLTLEYIKKGMFCPMIEIPSNCCFVENNDSLTKMQSYIDEFAKHGTRLQFSISIDGKYCDNISRQRNNNKIYDDAFYEKLFGFAKMYNYFFHPMVAPHNIQYWKENYEWWKETLEQYGFNHFEALMMLEVRNPEWDDEKIKQYCEFNEMVFNDFYENICNKDPKKLFDLLLHVPREGLESPIQQLTISYAPYLLNNSDTFHGCSLPSSLIVRVGDLAICPCHRTAYNKYLYGHFITDGTTITGIEANNVQFAIKALMSNIKIADPGCDSCEFNTMCLGGCLGSQLEEMGDPFIPIPSVCNFFRVKHLALIDLYEKLGIFELMETVKEHELHYECAQFYLTLYKNIKGGKQNNGMGQCCRDFS